MQNIWSKAYFYQLNQPKAPHPPDDQCWLVNLGQKHTAVGGRGEATLLQCILHLIVSRDGMAEVKTHLLQIVCGYLQS